LQPPPVLGTALGNTLELPQGQRHPATVLFADIAGSVALAERIGDEQAFSLMQSVLARWIAIVREHKGTVQDLAGDGIMALFGAPIALADAPICACRAALGIREHMQGVADDIAQRHSIRPDVRIGVHCGRVVVGQIGEDNRAVGDTANMAARLQQEAGPGTILISAQLRDEIAGRIDAAFLGERKIKGKALPQKVYRLNGIRPDITRFGARLQQGVSPFVGRDAEMNRLESAWRAATNGTPAMVFITGDPGIGKSRLVHEFLQRRPQGSVVLLQGHCSPDASATAFSPFIEVIRRAFHIPPEMPRQQVTQKLVDGLSLLGLPAEEHQGILLNLLGFSAPSDDQEIDTQTLGLRTRQCLQEFLVARCRGGPALLVVEDLHWTDSASQELLRRIALLRDIALLVVCTCRPEYDVSWVSHAGAAVLHLPPLESDGILQLVRHRLGGDTLSDSLIQSLVEKCDGNPLFGEEMAGHVVERVASPRSGKTTERVRTAELLPATIESLLLERIDSVGEVQRRVLQIASVVGQRFDSLLLTEILGNGIVVTKELVELESRQLIFADGKPPGHYRFKHALIRDAVYSTLVAAERQKLHLAVAEAIEAAFANRTGEVADPLAFHFSQTVEIGKAVRYLALAGEKSLRLYSVDEAHERFRQALTLLKAHPQILNAQARAELARNVARTDFLQSDIVSAIDVLQEFLPPAGDMQQSELRAFYLAELAHACIYAAQGERAKALLDSAYASAEEAHSERAAGHATLGRLWHTVFLVEPVGDQRQAVERLAREAVEIGRRHQDTWLMVTATFGFALDAVSHGNPREIRRRAELLSALYDETGDRRARALSLVVLAELDVFNSDYARAIERANEAAPWLLTPIDRLNVECVRLISAAMVGNGQEALSIFAEIRHKTIGRGNNLTCLMVDLPLGIADVASGHIGRGIRSMKRSARRLSRWGFAMAAAYEPMYIGEVYTRLLLRIGDAPSWRLILRNFGFLMWTLAAGRIVARLYLRRSVDLNRLYDAPSYVAWSLLNLGLLELSSNRRVAARPLLTEARRLAEGVDAFALLERIGAALAATEPPMIEGPQNI
jgi:predicted ATPase/class 3 adenylate cyclase